MPGRTLCLVALALLAAATGTAVATENTPPLAAAGVDQTVTPGSTVYLDANGSTDPDGEIASVNWTVETPGGATQTPACETCRQTEFEATTTGEYTVTLSVTDDDGATSSDTLYVAVESDDGPSVSLSGPSTVTSGDGATYTASATSSDASLQSLSWVVDGDVVSQQSLSGSDADGSLTTSFGTADNVSVSAVVYDTLGYRGSANRTVEVGSGGGGGDTPCNPTYQFCSDADGTITIDGETQIVNSNGEEGIQTYIGGELAEIDNPSTSQYIETRDPAGPQDERYVITDGASISDAVEDTNTGERVTSQTGNKADDSADDSSTGDGGGDEDGGSPPPFRDTGGGDGDDDDGGGSSFGGSGDNGGGKGGDKF